MAPPSQPPGNSGPPPPSSNAAALGNIQLELTFLAAMNNILGFVTHVIDVLLIAQQRVSMDVLQLTALLPEGRGVTPEEVQLGRQVLTRLVNLLSVFHPQRIELPLREARQTGTLAQLGAQQPSMANILPLCQVVIDLSEQFVNRTTAHLHQFDQLMTRLEADPANQELLQELATFIARMGAFCREELNPQLFEQDELQADSIIEKAAEDREPRNSR